MTSGALVQRWSGVLINGVLFLHGSVTRAAYSIQYTSRAYNTKLVGRPHIAPLSHSVLEQ